MRINQFKNFISFQKKLVATCSVKNGEKQTKCNIFELNKNEDKDYFEKLERKKQWTINSYLNEADYAINDGVDNERFFSIETRKKQCLGYAIIEDEKQDKRFDLAFLETCFPHSSKVSERKTKYVGETLLAFLSKLATKEGIEKISVPIIENSAKDFYTKNCGFFENSPIEGFIITKKEINSLINKNEIHTGSKIELF